MSPKTSVMACGLSVLAAWLACYPLQAGTIYPSQDVKILSHRPDTNYNAYPNNLGVGLDGAGQASRALLQFDVESVPGAIESATLNMYFYLQANSSQDLTVDVYRLEQPWEESAATWNSADGTWEWSSPGGTFDSVLIDRSNIGTQTSTWHEWDVTDVVKGWVEGTYSNDGLLLKPKTSDPGPRSNFYSSEFFSTPSKRPYLEITLAGRDEEPPTWCQTLHDWIGAYHDRAASRYDCLVEFRGRLTERRERFIAWGEHLRKWHQRKTEWYQHYVQWLGQRDECWYSEPVPEAATIHLLGTGGLIAIVLYRRRRVGQGPP